MMTRRTKGFTLIELLVVIAIIGLLVSILVPSIAKAQELAKRVSCRANLKGIGTAFQIYVQSNDDSWPFIFNDSGMEFDDPMDDTASTPWSLGTSDTQLHVAENLNLLVYDDHVGFKMFRCPSESSSTMSRDESGERYGFGNGSEVYIDYGYHNGYRDPDGASDGNPAALSSSNNPGLVIMADQPQTDSYPPNLNGASNNHGEDGINYLRSGGDAGWSESAEAGANDDNVFQSEGSGGVPDDDDDTVLISPDAGL